MANTQALCTSFLVETMCGIHALGTTVVRAATTADTVKGALYSSSATMGASTTAYTTTAEATGAGYSAGGVTVSNATPPTSSGTTAYWTPSAVITFPTITVSSVDCLLLYNSTQGGKAIAVLTFPSQTITAGTLTLAVPANTSTTALIRFG